MIRRLRFKKKKNVTKNAGKYNTVYCLVVVCMQTCIYVIHIYSECVIASVIKIIKAKIRKVRRRVLCDHSIATGRFSCRFIFHIFVIFSVVLSLFLIRRRKPGM